MHHKSRLATKPGITGMWQVSGRSDITDFEEVVRLDTEYIEKSNMIYYQLSDGAWFLVRPSGTEPKIKFYYGVKGLSASDSADKLSELGDLVKGMFE